jgi:hypothetical protein
MISVTVTNNTTEKLKVICADEKKELSPNESKVFHGTQERTYYFKATSLEGVIKFQKEYSSKEMDQIGYKIIIPSVSSD